MRPLLFGMLALALPQPVRAHTIVRASLSSNEVQGNADSTNCCISGNGRFVAFSSLASSLLDHPNDTNGIRHVFVRDLELGTTERVGENGDWPAISGDGRYVVYNDPTQTGLWLRDRRAAAPQYIGLGRIPSISGNGQRIVYSLDHTVYLLDREDNLTTEVAHSSYYPPYLSISRNGKYVGITSDAPDLVPGDTNGCMDAFVYDVRAGSMQRVSVSSLGVEGNDISRDAVPLDNGEVIFASIATTLVPGDTTRFPFDFFVHNVVTGTTEYLDPNYGCGPQNWMASASKDGRYVAFGGWTGEILQCGLPIYGIFRYDRQTGTTDWLDRSPYYSWTEMPTISADGTRVAFYSSNRKLVRHDNNGVVDVFVWQGSHDSVSPRP